MDNHITYDEKEIRDILKKSIGSIVCIHSSHQQEVLNTKLEQGIHFSPFPLTLRGKLCYLGYIPEYAILSDSFYFRFSACDVRSITNTLVKVKKAICWLGVQVTHGFQPAQEINLEVDSLPFVANRDVNV